MALGPQIGSWEQERLAWLHQMQMRDNLNKQNSYQAPGQIAQAMMQQMQASPESNPTPEPNPVLLLLE